MSLERKYCSLSKLPRMISKTAALKTPQDREE